MLESKKKANKNYDKKNMGMIGISAQKTILNYINNYVNTNTKNTVSRYGLLAILYCIDNNIELKDIDIKEYLATHSIIENEDNENEAEKEEKED